MTRQFRSNDSGRPLGDGFGAMTFLEHTHQRHRDAQDGPHHGLLLPATASTPRHFHDRGWNVGRPPMRTPRQDVLPQSGRLRMLALDVTRQIGRRCGEAGTRTDRRARGQMPGVGAMGAFGGGHADRPPRAENLRDQHVRRDGDGPATCPLRARRAGVVVNVTSSVTLARMPLVAVYAASEAAIEGSPRPWRSSSRSSTSSPSWWRSPGYGPSTNFTSNGQRACTG